MPVRPTDEHINRGLPSDFRDQICPASSERAIAQSYALTGLFSDTRMLAALDLKSHVVHIGGRFGQVNVDFEPTVLNHSVHRWLPVDDRFRRERLPQCSQWSLLTKMLTKRRTNDGLCGIRCSARCWLEMPDRQRAAQ